MNSKKYENLKNIFNIYKAKNYLKYVNNVKSLLIFIINMLKY